MARRGRVQPLVPSAFVVMWSSAFVAGALGVGATGPLVLISARFIGASVLLAGLALVLRRPWPKGGQFVHIAVSGVLMQAVQFGALYSAIGLGLPAGLVALVQGLNPALIAMLAVPVLKERVAGRQWWGFAVGAAGVVLALSDQWSHGAAVLCAVLGLLGLAAGTVYQKRFVRDMDVFSGTAVQFAASLPLVALATVATEPIAVTAWGSFLAALVWIVLVNSVGTFVLLNLMLRSGAASTVGTLFFLTPAVTAVLAWLTLGSALSPVEIAGLALGGVGVLLAGTSSAAFDRALNAANLRALRQWSLGHRRRARAECVEPTF
jgi:drug/metabolite transporter (DMT)-like permease